MLTAMASYSRRFTILPSRFRRRAREISADGLLLTGDRRSRRAYSHALRSPMMLRRTLVDIFTANTSFDGALRFSPMRFVSAGRCC